MLKKKLILMLLMFPCLLVAQQYELGKVTKAELEEKSHSLEPDASAAILFSSGTTYLDFSQNEGFIVVTDTDIKIKIYKKEGYDWATKMIEYYTANVPKEKVEFSKAITYNLINGAIEKTKLKSEGEFDEKINKFWAQKKITMPNVKEGSIIEFRTSIRSPFLSTFPKWNFQTTIPVNYSTYTTKIPEFYIYNPNFRGYIFPKKEQKIIEKSHNFLSTEKVEVGNAVRTNMAEKSLKYKEIITTYTAEKMPAMSEEEFVNNIDNFTSSIEHELALVKYPNTPIKSFSVTWDDVVRTIYDSDDFGGELKKSGYFEKDLQTLIAGLNSKEEKTAAIFNYVKNRMNWNELFGYSCNDGVNRAYKDKTGNVAEINLMLTAMLRYAGISANPILVSTRKNGIAISPNRTAYNYVIVGVEVENDVILLDATDKSSMPNIIPVRALNWEGRIIRQSGSSTTVNLTPKKNSKEVINIVASIDNLGLVSGKAKDMSFEYNAYVFRKNYAGLTKDSYIENVEKYFTGLEIQEYESDNSSDLSKPITESYSFTHNTLAEVIGDRIYFSPLLFFAKKQNPFKQEKREYPIDFGFPQQDKYSFTINIPEGYTIESLPKPLTLAMEENIGNFKFNISTSGKQIQIVTSLDINSANISQNYYETLKNFYQKVVEKQNEKIVLKKV